MGTHRYGKNYRLKVDTGGGTFVAVGGEMSLQRKSSSDKIDFSSKDDGSYKTSGYGQKEITVSASGNLKLPDTGFAALYAAQAADVPEIEVQIVNTLTDDVVFQCVMGIGNYSDSFATNGPVPWSCDLTTASAPTVDDMSVA